MTEKPNEPDAVTTINTEYLTWLEALAKKALHSQPINVGAKAKLIDVLFRDIEAIITVAKKGVMIEKFGGGDSENWTSP